MNSLPGLARIAVAAIVLALLGCGSAPVAHVSSPFTTSDATVFDQGVDFVDDPDILEGHWSEDWTRDLHHRMGSADLVETVHIVSLRVNTQPDQEPTYAIDIAPDAALYGDALDLDLRATTGDAGYSSIDSNQRRLLSGSFLLFVKWTQGADGSLVAKWHICPASAKITALVRELAASRQAGPHAADANQPTITEHTN